MKKINKKVKLEISPKRFLLKNRKGELTTQQLVGLIILIASFAVVLFFLFRLNLGESSDKEICHNSVVMQSQSTLKTGSLDCKTSYVCISGGGNCEEFNPTATINVKTKEETLKAIADAISDCWWMFGEGKVDYVGYSWAVDYFVGTNCAICSIIKFDEQIQEEISEVDLADKKIFTSEKYSIITGMRNQNTFIESQIIKSSEINSLNCDEFITKA